MARLPHQRLPAIRRNAVEQRAAGLNVGDDRHARAGFEQVLGIDHQQLVTPDDPPLAVDRADPIAVTVKSHSEIEVLLRDELAQIDQIFLHRGVRMMVRKIPVDFSKEDMMLARQARDELFERGASGTIARVPANLQAGEGSSVDPVERLEHPVDVSIHDLKGLDRTGAAQPVARPCQLSQFQDIGPEERPATEYHLEAIVIGGIVAASYLYAAIHLFG